MITRTLAGLLALALHAAALAQHAGDVAVTRSGSTLFTNGYDANLQPVPERLFLGTFGDTGVPRFTSNPGFEAATGTFVSGTRLGFHAVDGLRRWDGSAFVTVPGMQLEAKYLTAKFTVGETAVNGFDLAVQSNGGIHRHLSFTLRDALGTGPASGAWLLSLQLYATGTPGSSEPFWILFNDGLDPAAFEAIAAQAKALLLPSDCPGDLDGSGLVDAGDIGSLLVLFGETGGPGDLDGSGLVDAGDIGSLLVLFGECPSLTPPARGPATPP
jgi:hypothetical protein